jgi:guanylate kinase
MSYKKQMMVILSAPSGGGKTSIAKRLLELDKNLSLSISATTRQRRSKEKESVDYFFKSKGEFEKMIESDQFLEYATIHHNNYGTPLEYVENRMREGFDILFDIDFQGAYQIMEKAQAKVVSIFILPPDINELKKRLEERSQDSEDEINKRFAIAEEEMKHAKSYDHIVINDDFDKAVSEIQTIIEIEREKCKE